MKKILALTIAIVLMFSCLSLTTFATETADITTKADVWDGSVATGFADGDGTAENPYQIATGAQLAYFSTVYVPQDFYETYVVLTNDIDLNNNQWTPIGNYDSNYFCGTFDGQNHKISNMKITVNYVVMYVELGLFGLCGGTIKNIALDGEITLNGEAYHGDIGGIAATTSSRIENCISYVDITLNQQCTSIDAGGITGVAKPGTTISNCINYGTINYASEQGFITTHLGGICASAQNANIYSCKNAGNILTNAGKTVIGGIVGFADTNSIGDMYISNCYNTGTLSGINDTVIGGIAADIRSYATSHEDNIKLVIKNCLFAGKLAGTSTKMGAIYSNLEKFVAKIELKNLYYLSTSGSGTSVQNTEATAVEEAEKKELLEKMTADSGVDIWSTDADGNVVLAMELADYTAVNAEIAKIPTDLSCYTDASVKALTDAKNGVVEGKKKTEQSAVDTFATAIKTAIAGLILKPADYSAVDTALAKIPTDLSNYSEASVKALTDAKAKIVKDLDITKQSQVDAFVTAIKTAIAGLTLKTADYSSVDTALAKIPADLSGYTADSVKVLTDAKAKIVKDLDITKQSQVDGFATAIKTAIAGLTLKPADYSAVDTALAKIPTDLSNYSEASVKALTDAKAKIVKDLDITKQSQVDAFVTAIETALTNLKKAETKPVTSPNTGDNSTAPIVVLLAAVSSLSVLVLAKKRKINQPIRKA